jgi:hypothetical protein
MITRPLCKALMTSLLVALATPTWSYGQTAGGCGRGASAGATTGSNMGEAAGGRGGGNWNNSTAEGERIGAAAGAYGDTEGGYTGPRAGGDAGQQSPDLSSQIQAVSVAQQLYCASIRSQIAQLQPQVDVADERETTASIDLAEKQQDARNMAAMLAIRNPAALDKLLASLDDFSKNPRVRAMRDYLLEVRLRGSSDPSRLTGMYQQDVADAQAKLDAINAQNRPLEQQLETLRSQLLGCQGQ